MEEENKKSKVRNLTFGRKTIKDKFGIERPKPRVGMIEKFNKSFEDEISQEKHKKK